MSEEHGGAFGAEWVEAFVERGFARVEGAFSREVAAEARARLWRDLAPAREDDPSSWHEPVVRLGWYGDPPFIEAARSPRLAAACDAVAGRGRWLPRGDLGSFPVRFPSARDPGDTGWHVDASFGTDDPDFLRWRTNVVSQGRALLLLVLFSDVGEDDAPTRLRVGSHVDVARALAPAGDAGFTLGELVASDFGATAPRDVAFATGDAGTVWVCHPFLVHAAQALRGTRPRFLAQPPLLPASELRLDGPPDETPVERAVRRALAG